MPPYEQYYWIEIVLHEEGETYQHLDTIAGQPISINGNLSFFMKPAHLDHVCRVTRIITWFKKSANRSQKPE